MTTALKCPGCSTAHALDKALLSKGAPNEDNEIHSGYRVECEKCGAAYMVRVGITDVGTAKEKATVTAGPLSATAAGCAERDAIADKARAAAAKVDSPQAKLAEHAVEALEKLGVGGDVAAAAGMQVHKEAAEGAVQDALAPLYSKQATAKAKAAAGKRAAGDKALASL